MIKENTRPPFLIKAWMKILNFDGLATPWDTIYFKDEKSSKNERLRRHEMKHIEQMNRDGKLCFLIKYCWYWLTVGYEKNPYEISARLAEKEITPKDITPYDKKEEEAWCNLEEKIGVEER